MSRLIFVSLFLVLFSFFNCGGGGGGKDVDAEENAIEVTSEENLEILIETEEEQVAQEMEDEVPQETEEEAIGEVTDGDVQTQDELEADLEIPDDTSGEEEVSPRCASAGGFCTAQRWEMCPRGYEPSAPDMHLGCEPGWCCVDAPPSSCSDDSDGNCVLGDNCTGCWGSLPGYSCEVGRVCCIDICY